MTRGSFLEDENDAQTVESKSPPSRGEGETLPMEGMPSSKAKQKRKRLDEARAAPGTEGPAGGWEPARRGRGASGGAVPRRAGWRRSALRGFKGWLWTGALGCPEGTVDDGTEAAERRGRGRTCGRVGHACELIDSGRPHLKQLWAVLCARKRATQPLLTPNHPPPRYQPYGGCSVAFAKSKGYVLKCNIYFFLQF